MKKLFVGVLATALVACSEPFTPAGALVGRWSSRLDLESGYERVQLLNFRSDGVLEHRMRIYRNGRLESSNDFTHTYIVRNDSLFTSPDGPPGANWSLAYFNRGKLAFEGHKVIITYPWFGPADEPVTVTQEFFRAAPEQRFPF
jgi:hypothetical protein